MLPNLPDTTADAALRLLGVHDLARLQRASRRFSLDRPGGLVHEAHITVREGTEFQALVQFRGFAQCGNIVSARGMLYGVISEPCPEFDYISLQQVLDTALGSGMSPKEASNLYIQYRNGAVEFIEDERRRSCRPGKIHEIVFSFRFSALA
mmetsp:Transcript_30281/g.83530  ORF Transcript_30281/g.83530 Transcript_30281/m.83530 type:complete len:151 (-) Transcript_30281:107-559(-)